MVICYVHKDNRTSLFKQKLLSLYRLDSKYKLLSPWIWQSPVHHVVGKYKIIRCSVICAMTTIARKSVTMTLIKSSGKNINYLKMRGGACGSWLSVKYVTPSYR